MIGVEDLGELRLYQAVRTRIQLPQRRAIPRRTNRWLLFVLILTPLPALADYCEVCRQEITGSIYMWEDKVEHVKKRLCHKCVKLPESCFVCSLPLLKNYKTLPDGRTICERDARTVVLDDEEAAKICQQVKADLDSQFIRFITFPDTNATVELMDRVTLQEMFKVIGNDYTCPNALGCTEPKTNAQGFTFRISLLSGLPREQLITTCVHEYTHAWIDENTPPPRKKTIGKDAVEGFCELVAYLFADAHHYTLGQEEILKNHYTRGQVHLFIKAERMFGFNELVEWMQFGDTPLLVTNDLRRIRQLETFTDTNSPTRTELRVPDAPPTSFTNPPVPLAETLTLKSISGRSPQRLAIINDRTFGVNDQAVMKLATTNMPIRCLEIRTNSVLIRIEDTGEKQELFLPED